MEITSKSPVRKIVKGTILLHAGDNCQFGYKVLHGCLKSYVIDKLGKEQIIQFAPENWFITDLDSLINGRPSGTFIEAIEDSEVIMLGKSVFENLIIHEKEDLVEYNNKVIRLLIATNRRLLSLLTLTAEERYLDFLETYPELLQRLPLKLIASYLGMRPEYLSDVRRKLTKR